MRLRLNLPMLLFRQFTACVSKLSIYWMAAGVLTGKGLCLFYHACCRWCHKPARQDISRRVLSSQDFASAHVISSQDFASALVISSQDFASASWSHHKTSLLLVSSHHKTKLLHSTPCVHVHYGTFQMIEQLPWTFRHHGYSRNNDIVSRVQVGPPFHYYVGINRLT